MNLAGSTSLRRSPRLERRFRHYQQQQRAIARDLTRRIKQIPLIISAVSVETGIPAARITSHDRPEEITDARHLAFWLVRELLNLSYPTIGEHFSPPARWDHQAILHACRKVRGFIDVYPDWRARAQTLHDRLASEISNLKSEIAP